MSTNNCSRCNNSLKDYKLQVVYDSKKTNERNNYYICHECIKSMMALILKELKYFSTDINDKSVIVTSNSDKTETYTFYTDKEFDDIFMEWFTNVIKEGK